MSCETLREWREPGELVILKMANAVRVEIPRIATSDHRSLIIAGLHNLYKEHDANVDWIVDMSRLKDIPLSLCDVLLCHGESLKRQGRQMRIVGIETQQLPLDYKREVGVYLA